MESGMQIFVPVIFIVIVVLISLLFLSFFLAIGCFMCRQMQFHREMMRQEMATKMNKHQQAPVVVVGGTDPVGLEQGGPVADSATHLNMASSYAPLLPPGTVFQFPSRWRMKRSWFHMHIEDEQGNKVFRANNIFRSFGWNLDFYDVRTGELIAQIKQKIQLGMPKFVIIIDGRENAEIKQEFGFRPKFKIDTNDGPVEISGNWLAHSYTFTRNGRLIAQVEKSWAALRDSYIVEIQPGENVIFILACCVVIDKCMTKK